MRIIFQQCCHQRPVKHRKLSVVSQEPASDNESAPESLKESTPESETMTMNEQQGDANKGLEEQLLELQTNYDRLQQKYVDDMAKVQQKLF
jgi:hypothetical protein